MAFFTETQQITAEWPGFARPARRPGQIVSQVPSATTDIFIYTLSILAGTLMVGVYEGKCKVRSFFVQTKQIKPHFNRRLGHLT